ncbi:MAG: PTS sugar transporter subunit IIB [Erysipelotrichaceae bacterium]|nr:PTS sugar transporter subunit IIB [Erysipelotrichaceae bacterium]
MIKHLRIDNRLIHGQVAVTWKNHIGAQAIIVTNDKVAADPIQKMALPMAARGSKVLVYSVQETIDYAKANPKETMFVICKHPEDALALIEAGCDIEHVNVGNAAPIAGTKYVMVTKSIAATAEDAVVYRKIAELRGGTLRSRMVPTAEEIDFLKALEEAGL